MYEQMLCDEAVTAWEKREQEDGRVPYPLPRDGGDACGAANARVCEHNALFASFVSYMRRMNSLRGIIQQNFRGVDAVEICSYENSVVHTSMECSQCKNFCYLATIVMNSIVQPSEWVHICLECAVESLSKSAASPGGGTKSSRSVGHGGGKKNGGLLSLMFIKPHWGNLERIAQEMEHFIHPLGMVDVYLI